MSTSSRLLRNEGVPGHHEFIPLNKPAIGTLLEAKNDQVSGVKDIRTFRPLTIRNVEFKNRIWASPMCMYSAEDGRMTDFHLMHYGTLATRGMGAICVEASAVLPEGRISPEDLGLWSDEQIKPAKRVVDFVHAQGTKIGVQLAHAGRKASMFAPWVKVADKESDWVPKDVGGWPDDVWGPSTTPFSDKYNTPKEASQEYIDSVVQAFVDAARRAEEIGYDFIEIHGAHGYLIHSFLSPLSNVRKDSHGGSLPNRLRLALDIARSLRAVWSKPLFFRLSATDWYDKPEKEGDEWTSWGVEQSVLLSKELRSIGIDLIDTSSGGTWIKAQIPVAPGYQVPFAAQIKKAVPDVLVGAVGLLTSASQIENVLRAGQADVVFVAREVLRNSDFVLDCAEEFGVVVQPAAQYSRAWTRMLEARNAENSAWK